MKILCLENIWKFKIWKFILVFENVLKSVEYYKWMATCAYATLKTEAYWTKVFNFIRKGGQNLVTATIQWLTILEKTQKFSYHRRRHTSTNTIRCYFVSPQADFSTSHFNPYYWQRWLLTLLDSTYKKVPMKNYFMFLLVWGQDETKGNK